MNDNGNVDGKPAELPQSVAPSKPDLLVDLAHGYLTSCCLGLCVSHGEIPPPAMWHAMIEAFGRIISTVTASDNPHATLAVRVRSKEQFAKAVDKFVPAIKPVASVMIPNGRG